MLKYSISVVFEAPSAYAYSWCTDFRDDDPLIAGQTFTRHILRKKKNEYVWIQHYQRDGKAREGVRIVTLKPPNAWHSEAINEEKESAFDYKVSSLGKKRSKLTISAKITYKTIEPEESKALAENLSADWVRYKAALDSDYASGRPASS